MAPRPVKTPGSMPYPRRPDRTEEAQFWACYVDDITECRVANLSKSLFKKYFKEYRYKSFKDALGSYEKFIESVCAQKEPKLPWEFIDEPENHNLTLMGTVVERHSWLLGTKTPLEGVTVTIDGNTTSTDSEGKFSICVHYGRHDFYLTKEGFQTWFRSFSFKRLVNHIGVLAMDSEIHTL